MRRRRRVRRRIPPSGGLNRGMSGVLYAFDDLRTALMSAPVFALPDTNLPYVLKTDASDKALGGVLMQIRPDNTRMLSSLIFITSLIKLNNGGQCMSKRGLRQG